MHPELTKQLVRQQLEEARSSGLFGSSVVLEEIGYPTFFIRFRAVGGYERLLRFDYLHYDTFPMEVYPVDLATREALPPDRWMQRDGGAFPIHGATNSPFLCAEGLRSFYTHPGHDPLTTNQPWEKHRAHFRLVALLQFIAGRFASGRWA